MLLSNIFDSFKIISKASLLVHGHLEAVVIAGTETTGDAHDGPEHDAKEKNGAPSEAGESLEIGADNAGGGGFIDHVADHDLAGEWGLIAGDDWEEWMRGGRKVWGGRHDYYCDRLLLLMGEIRILMMELEDGS